MAYQKRPPGLNEGKNTPFHVLDKALNGELLEIIKDREKDTNKKTKTIYLRQKESTQRHSATLKEPVDNEPTLMDEYYSMIEFIDDGGDEEKVLLTDGNYYTVEQIMEYTGHDRLRVLKRLAMSNSYYKVMLKKGYIPGTSVPILLDNGKEYSLEQLMEIVGCKRSALRGRLRKTKNLEKLINYPSRGGDRNKT